MRLQIHVPMAQADRWSPEEGSLSFGELQKRIVNITGQITVSQVTGHWKGPRDGYVQRPVLVVETLLIEGGAGQSLGYVPVWNLLRTYARQLLDQGEESVLIVQDNEPTFIK